jgi:hypothetical protein
MRVCLNQLCVPFFLLLSACGNDVTFQGNNAKMLEQVTSCSVPQELQSNSQSNDSPSQPICSVPTPVQGTSNEEVPSCLMSASRVASLATTCIVSVSARGSELSEVPVLKDGKKLQKTANVWEGSTACSAQGEILSAKVSNVFGAAECQSEITAIEKPRCSLIAENNNIEVGQSVSVKLISTGGPVSAASINNASVAIDQAVNFTPAVAGEFVLNGSVANPRSTETCKLVVTIREKPVAPVIPASCSVVAVRESPTSLLCDVTVTSTGGALTSAPTISEVGPTAASGAKWTAKVGCSDKESTITALVTNVAGTRSCETRVAAIAMPACQIQPNAQNIILGDELKVTLRSTAGPVVSASLNNLPIVPNGMMTLKPTTVGALSLSGVVTNPAGSGSCSASVVVDSPNKAACVHSSSSKGFNFSIAPHKDTVSGKRDNMPQSDVSWSPVQRFHVSEVSGNILPVTNFGLDDVAFIVKETDKFAPNERDITIPDHAMIIKDGSNAAGASGQIDSKANTIYRYKGKAVTIETNSQSLASALNKIVGMGIQPINHNQIKISDMRARGFVDASGNVAFRVVHVAHGIGFINMTYTLQPCQ